MSELISIREAAHRLGVSADTLRQWERDKRLTAERTEGGHRRYRVEDIERLLARRSKTGHGSPPAPGATTQSHPPASQPTPLRFPTGRHIGSFWQEQLQDARARVEIKRLRREALEQQAEIDKRRSLAHQEEEALGRRERHREQLQELKGFGRALVPAWAEAEPRAEIIRDIEHYVTAEHFPLDLPIADARVVVQARVGAALARLEHRCAAAAAKEECERRRVNDQRQLELLIASGLSVARRQTLSWHIVDQARALRDVTEELREEVRADWGYAQVEALVTEILSEFEEWDEREEVADAMDDQEGEDDDEY